MSNTTLLSTGWSGPDEIRRGAAYTASLTLSRSGATVTITAATVRVLDESGTVKSSGSATIGSGVATYAIADSVTSSVDPVMGWTIEWTATTSYGTDVYTNPCDVVLYRVAPVLTWDHLLARHRDLDTRLAVGTDTTTAKSRAQEKQDAAWQKLSEKLRARGQRACLVLDSYAMKEAHLLLTLAMIFRDLGTSPDAAEWALAADYEQKFLAEWDGLSFTEADPSTWRATGDRKGTRSATFVGSGGGGGAFRYAAGRSSRYGSGVL